MRWAWTKFGGIFLCIGNSDIHLRQHVWASMPFLYTKQNWNNPTKMRAVVCEVQTFPYSSFSISLIYHFGQKKNLPKLVLCFQIFFGSYSPLTRHPIQPFFGLPLFFRYLYSFLICSTCSTAILLLPNSDSQPTYLSQMLWENLEAMRLAI